MSRLGEGWRSFLLNGFKNPLQLGAIAPSSRALAQEMASYIDISCPGPIVELGPGTGLITQALLDHGVCSSRLILVEYSSGFVSLLKKKFPKVNIIHGDAYDLNKVLAQSLKIPPAYIVSSLPLLLKPQETRLSLVDQALDLLPKSKGAFIQFSYNLLFPPVRVPIAGCSLESSQIVWGNMPPARVWIYRKLHNNLRGA